MEQPSALDKLDRKCPSTEESPPLLYKCIIIDFLLLLPTYKLVGAPSAKEEEGDKLVPLRSAWIWEKLTQ